MAQFAIYLRSGDVKELRADYYALSADFFNFYEETGAYNETTLKFSISASDVSTVEKVLNR